MSKWVTISGRVLAAEAEEFKRICLEELDAKTASECVRKAIRNVIIHRRVRQVRDLVTRLEKLLAVLELASPDQRRRVVEELRRVVLELKHVIEESESSRIQTLHQEDSTIGLVKRLYAPSPTPVTRRLFEDLVPPI